MEKQFRIKEVDDREFAEEIKETARRISELGRNEEQIRATTTK